MTNVYVFKLIFQNVIYTNNKTKNKKRHVQIASRLIFSNSVIRI